MVWDTFQVSCSCRFRLLTGFTHWFVYSGVVCSIPQTLGSLQGLERFQEAIVLMPDGLCGVPGGVSRAKMREFSQPARVDGNTQPLVQRNEPDGWLAYLGAGISFSPLFGCFIE